MAKVFITGSADGLGSLAARQLISEGHQVVLHARNEQRGLSALKKAPGTTQVLLGDLSKMDEVVALAHQVNKLGPFDAIIHNAGVYSASHEEIFAVNSLAPFILTSLIEKPKRLVYLGSGMHTGGRARLEKLERGTNYSDSKFQILLLMKAVAKNWPALFVNVVNPGWVPTKMGGRGAPDSLEEGYVTQVWLATSEEAGAKVTGRYFFHKKQVPYAPAVDEKGVLEAYITRCEKISRIPLVVSANPEG